VFQMFGAFFTQQMKPAPGLPETPPIRLLPKLPGIGPTPRGPAPKSTPP